MNEPTIRGHDVSVRDHITELAAISEDTNKKVMLASLGAGQHADASLAHAPKPNPIAPGQLRPCGLAFIPMQDDCVVGSSSHRRLPTHVRSNPNFSHGRSRLTCDDG